MKKQFFKVLSAILLISLILSVIPFAASAADNVDASAFTSVILNVGADETQKNLTWYYQGYDEFAEVRYGKSTSGSLPIQYQKAPAVGTLTEKEGGYYSYKATMTGLQENSTYAYQLVVGNTVSKTYTFKTYDFDDGFTFAFTGDTQIGSASNWLDTLNKIQNPSLFGNVSFIVSPGDQVSTYNNRTTMEGEYDGYIASNLSSIAVSTTIGPWHDAQYDQSSGEMLLADAYRDHYNLPNLSTTAGVTETTADYYYTYGNVLFMHLNVTNYRNLSKADFNAHVSFIQKTMKDNPQCNWQIVVMHYPFYTTGSHTNDSITNQFRSMFAPKFAELGIDIVLQGHDHMYTRSHMMTDATVISKDKVANNKVVDPVGTLYVCGTSSSGGGFYGHMNDTYSNYIAVERPEFRKGATFFEVTDNSITLKSYFLDTATPELIDTFTIEKTQVEYNYSATVTVNGGEAKQYDDKYDLSEILAIYNTSDYKNKEILIKLESDLELNNAVEFASATGATFKIDLNGYTLTTKENEKIIISAENTTLEFYSSFEDGNLILGDYIYFSTSATVNFGSKEYRNNLTVTSSGYLMNLATIPTGTKIETNLLYSNFNYGTNGIITLLMGKAALATLNINITGSTLNGSTAPFQYNTSKAPTTGGAFTIDSSIVIKDTSFANGSTTVGVFEGANFADRYFGTVTIEDSSFDGYELNGDTILADENATRSGNYLDTLTDYDPTKAITVGARTIFKNSGNTFANGAFTASNINLGPNSTIKTNGDAIEVAYSFDFTAKVTVDGVAYFHIETSLYDILEAYNSVDYAGKEIIITLNKDMTTPGTAYTFDKADNVTVVINLAGYTWTIGSYGRLILASNNYNFTIYSSEAGGKLYLNDGIQPSSTGTLIFGSKADKDYLEIYSPDASPTGTYVVDLGALEDGAKVTIKFLYSVIRSTTNGLIRLNAATGAVATIDAEVIGCSIKGKHLIQFNSDNTPGVFSLDSKITFKNTDISSTSTSQRQLFDKGVFANRYFGTMYFEYTTFDRYTINGDLIYSNKDADGSNYYSSNVAGSNYDPNKVIVIGEGCKFTNTNGSVTADGFTAKNIVLAENCQIEMAGETVTIIYVEPVIPEEPEDPTPDEPDEPTPEEPLYKDNVTVVIDETPVGYDITDIASLLGTLNSNYNGKTIYIYLNPNASYDISSQVELSNNNNYIIDLAGATLDMGGMIPMTANAGIQIYSSRAGGKFTMNNRFHINGSASITLGYDNPEYTDYLTVQTSEYILYTGAIDSSVTVNINYLYTRINCSTRGLMRIRCTEAATLTSEIKGCTIVGTTVLIQSHTGYAGIFNETSSILLKDSTFTGPSGKVTNVFETSGEPAFVNKFAGTVTIEGCAFENYYLNANTAANTKFIVGDGTTFTNSGDTFIGNAFSATNIKLADGCTITSSGDKVEIKGASAPVIPETNDNVTVVIDDQVTGYDITDLAELINTLNSANSGKTIYIYLNPKASFTIGAQANLSNANNFAIDLGGATLELNALIAATGDAGIQIYSTKEGGQFKIAGGRFHLNGSSTVTLGYNSSKYNNYLTVTTGDYLIYTAGLSDSNTIAINYLYSTINANGKGLMRVRASGAATLNVEIKGCTVTGTSTLFQSHTGYAGIFNETSTITLKDTTFTGPTGKVTNVFETSGEPSFANKFAGKMTIEGCTFENYCINADAINAAKITVGGGTTLVNYGSTFTGNAFTASNITLAKGCEIKADGDKMTIVATGNTDEPDTPDTPDTPVQPEQPDMPEYPAIPDQPEAPKVTDAPAGTTAIVTIDGQTTYHAETDLYTILSIYNKAENEGKTINIELLADLNYTSENRDYVKANITINVAGKTLTLSRRLNIPSGTKLLVYSSIAGGKLDMYADQGFVQLYKNSELVLGHTNEQYKNFLTVNSAQYLVYTDVLSASSTNNVTFINSTVNCGRYNLLRVRGSGSSATPTFNINITGCNITATASIIMFNDGTGSFSANSTLFATNSSFTGPSASQGIFDSTLAGKFTGTMCFTGCTFDNFTINANIIPGAKLIFGAGCSFTNAGATFAGNYFASTNNCVASGCELKADGSKMVIVATETPDEPDVPVDPDTPVEPEVTYNIYVTIDGNTVGYETTDLAAILTLLQSTDYSDKTVLITLNPEATFTLGSEVEIKTATNLTVVIDLNGATFNMGKPININEPNSLQIYSSKPGAQLNVGGGRFQLYKASTLTLGYDNAEYKGYLNVTTDSQIVYTTSLSSSSTITANFYYSNIATGGFGLMRLRGKNATDTPTLNATIKGCNIIGTKGLFFLNTNGIFSENSTVVALDTTFTGPSGKVTGIFDSSFTDAYDGYMSFTGCTFANYTINSDIIEFATIEIGIGTSFTGYGDTIADGKFAHENISLVNGAILVKNGDTYVVEEYKEDTSKFTPLSNLTLYSDIQYNIYIPALDQIISVTINGQVITSFEGYTDITVGGQKYYKVPVALGVANAMRDISLEIKYESELGGEKTLAYTLNIVKYANAILAGNYLEVEKNLIKDILSYIRSAYVYANTEETASVVATINAIIGENYDETSKPTDIESAEKTNGLDSITMELGNAPAFIFYIADGYTADQYVIRVNGFTPDCEVITEGGRTYIKVTMYAYAMVDTITYSIKGTDIKGEYNIKAYYEFALTKGEALTNLVERLWKYAESANAYREATK